MILNLDQNVVNEYLQYAQSVGYDLSDVIHTKQTQRQENIKDQSGYV